MVKKIKKIAVFTSGGDCPGLNAALRAVVNRATYIYGWDVIGIYDAGYSLYTDNPEYKKLNPSDFSVFESRLSGSILRCLTHKINPFPYSLPDASNEDYKANEENLVPKFAENIKKLGVDGLIITGGDGSLSIIYRVCKEVGLPFVGIPKTIDNDTPCTQISIGFSTAVDTCVDAMDHLITNAYSHKRWLILEVMGRHAGHIALRSGIAGGADAILIPEIKYTYKGLLARINDIKKKENRDYGIIVISEGAYSDIFKDKSKNISTLITEKLKEDGITAREDVLGHVQRGGITNSYDRRLATIFGTMATDVLANGQEHKMVGYENGKFKIYDMEQFIEERTEPVNKNSFDVKIAKSMGIYMGDV